MYDTDTDDDNDFEISSKLITLKENIFDKQLNIDKIREKRINKLCQEEKEIKEEYEMIIREKQEKIMEMKKMSDYDLIEETFKRDIEILNNEFSFLKVKRIRKDRSAIGLNIKIGDRMLFCMPDTVIWECECIGIEKKGLFGILKSPGNESLQGNCFSSLYKIYKLYTKTISSKNRKMYGSKIVEHIREGKSLGYLS